MITADELRVFLHDSGLDADIFNQAFANLDQGAAEVEAQLLLLEFIRIVNTNHQKHHTAKAVKPTELTTFNANPVAVTTKKLKSSPVLNSKQDLSQPVDGQMPRDQSIISIGEDQMKSATREMKGSRHRHAHDEPAPDAAVVL